MYLTLVGFDHTVSKGISRTPVLPASTTTTSVDSASLHFRVDYEQVKHLSMDEVVSSDVVSDGQHVWRTNCYLRGPEKYSEKDNGNYVSLYYRHLSIRHLGSLLDG